MEKLEDVVTEVKKHTDAMNKLAKTAEPIIKTALKEFLAEWPQVEAIRWTQYTPSFNDGEPCMFTLGSVEVKLAEDEESDEEEDEYGEYEDEDEEGWYGEYNEFPDGEKKLEKAVGSFQKKIESLEPILEEVFGNGVKIIANRKKIEIEEYYCE